MDNIFINSKNSITTDLHRFILNISDRINLNRSDNYAALSNFSIYYTWKNTEKSYRNNKC